MLLDAYGVTPDHERIAYYRRAGNAETSRPG